MVRHLAYDWLTPGRSWQECPSCKAWYVPNPLNQHRKVFGFYHRCDTGGIPFLGVKLEELDQDLRIQVLIIKAELGWSWPFKSEVYSGCPMDPKWHF